MPNQLTNNPATLAQPVALITGGGRGIGAATVRAFAQEGMRTCFTYLHDDDAATALAEDVSEQTTAVAVKADATNEYDVARAFDVAESLGRVSVVVNNVGATQKVAGLVEWTAIDIRGVLDVNLYSAILMSRLAIARWQEDPAGRSIINVSSAAATTGAPGEYIPYAAAKAGIDALTIGLAKEVASRGIRVNAVAPGTTDTDIHAAAGDPGRTVRVAKNLAIGRVAAVDEIAKVITWLASTEASYVSGAVLRVTGGA
jgi:NAD(P)-dependent dehydrogenase (short-subunit alcohol dehydrogenase family)